MGRDTAERPFGVVLPAGAAQRADPVLRVRAPAARAHQRHRHPQRQHADRDRAGQRPLGHLQRHPAAARRQRPFPALILLNPLAASATGRGYAEVPLDAVRKGGKVATTTVAPDADTLAPDADALAAAGLTGTTVFAQPVREATAPLADQAAAGSLAVDVHPVLPLEQATDGLATLAAGRARGKIVITIDA
ncbi:zinc-binding dehydrogenase [Nonomuraea sp. NPDC005650]|uniref:zinc-binding dehydrogenase n=1 Tax=Nonomuraea sp. NPDC005650 TaxID=3157045 RepID=UPI0033A7A5B2